MKIQFRELENDVRLIKLSGTLDTLGVGDVEVDFVRLCTGDGVCVIVDLSKVDYISSIGIPLLINSAKSLAHQGGKMALLSPKKSVENVLEVTGIPMIIPIYETVDQAVAELKK